jgi:hypothetical protein
MVETKWGDEMGRRNGETKWGAKWGVLIILQILIGVHALGTLGVPWIVDGMVSHTDFCATTDSRGGPNSSSSAVLHVHAHAREGKGLPERGGKPIVFRHGDATSPIAVIIG